MTAIAFAIGLILGGAAGLIAWVCGELAEWAENESQAASPLAALSTGGRVSGRYDDEEE